MFNIENFADNGKSVQRRHRNQIEDHQHQIDVNDIVQNGPQNIPEIAGQKIHACHHKKQLYNQREMCIRDSNQIIGLFADRTRGFSAFRLDCRFQSLPVLIVVQRTGDYKGCLLYTSVHSIPS